MVLKHRFKDIELLKQWKKEKVCDKYVNFLQMQNEQKKEIEKNSAYNTKIFIFFLVDVETLEFFHFSFLTRFKFKR